MGKIEVTQASPRMPEWLRRDFSISTTVPVPVLMTWLTPHVSSGRRPLYPGQLHHQGFRVRRRVNYRNQFRPWITGQFVPNAEGTRIDVSVVPPALPVALVGLFLLMTLGGLPITVLATTTKAIQGEFELTAQLVADTVFRVVIGAGLAAFLWRFHRFEMRRSESEIRRILNGHPPTAP